MLTASGPSGMLRYGYQVAARLGAWRLDGNGRVTATVVESDAFWLEQAGGKLALWLSMGTRSWVWPAIEVREIGASCVVQVVGSPESRD